MQQELFSIFDIKGVVYTPPFSAINTAVAQRSFAESVNEKGHTFNKYPDDFVLYYVGTFDTETASILVNENLQPLGTARDFLLPYGSIIDEPEVPIPDVPTTSGTPA